ncbi:hypothetical protein DFP72DRAFT_888029 [Ephemerocybe angulata]|uniref:F-box domain-containing protein n=1 Tax=Ephemerocybe angulata TaxID=980116 RepID=A0A8H6MC55_9AGAR|nr:hypothetical protein DFP72DRAFT_888029 [Tulosesus angulatus]
MGRIYEDGFLACSSISRVPLEVWASILRKATECPDTFTTSYLQGPSLTASERRRYGECMRTKRALSSVCRVWSGLTTPYLYEHVKLLHIRTLYSLLHNLTNSIGFQHGKMVTHGDYVLRLDVTFCDLNQETVGSDILSILQHLFRNLPNLKVLLLKELRCFYRPLRSMQATKTRRFFLESVTPKLEVISWIDGASVSAKLWASFLRSHPRIRALLLPCCEPLAGLSSLRIQLPHLEEVISCARRDLIFYPEAFTTGDLPSLKRLIHLLPYNQDYRPTYIGHHPFLLIHGHKLQSVHFWSFNRVGEFPLSKFLRAVQEACPKVCEIGLTCYWNDIVSFPSLPAVHTLAIRNLDPQFGKGDCRAMLRSLVEAKVKGLVGLRVVRFVDERNLAHLRKHFHQQLNSAATALAKLSVFIEGVDLP